MIESLKIKNFRSILDAEVQLKRFTVLVGANGSGKSNLVKALEFLSAIPARGIVTAVNRQGGHNGLIPKAIPAREALKKRVRFEYRVALPPLTDDKNRELQPPSVEHAIELSFSKDENVSVVSERIVFHEVLSLAQAMRRDLDASPLLIEQLVSPSSVTVQKGSKGAVHLSTSPQISSNNIDSYLDWFGLAFLEKFEQQVKTRKNLEEILRSISGSKRSHENTASDSSAQQRRYSLVDPTARTEITFAAQFAKFRQIVRSIRRYDFLLSELRTEQQVGNTRQLSPEGRNMPTVLRAFRDNPKNKDAWNRILRTFGAIAPYIASMKSSSLRSGKEFVEFKEFAGSRGVESWESSDGSLRALAILLALETHAPYSTVIIEEPEQNLHPWAVQHLVEHMREVVERRNLQVVITTHSQQLLECIRPEELIVATRTAEEGTKFRALNEIIPDGDIEMGEVGQAWVKGLLGGVPSYE